MRAGDILVLQNGKYVVIEKVQHEILDNPVTVYNFEVEDFHTYYVGNSSVLVHNDCGLKTIIESPNALSTVKGFNQSQLDTYNDAVFKLASGDTTGLHAHRLSTGNFAVDLKGFGKGRGAGRIIYGVQDGTIEIFEVSVKHYKK